MRTELRAYLESIGLSTDATEPQAWQFYRQLEGDHQVRANQIRFPQSDGGEGEGSEGGEAGSEGEGSGQRSAPAPQTQTDPSGLTVAQFEEAQQAERSRVAGINRLAAEHGIGAERAAAAVEDGSSIDQFRAYALEWLRSRRGTGVGNNPGGVGGEQADHLGRSFPQFSANTFNVNTRTATSGEQAAGLAMALLLRDSPQDPSERLIAVRFAGEEVVPRRVEELPQEARVRMESARDFAEQNAGMTLAEVAAECLRLDGVELVGRGAQGVIRTLQGQRSSFSSSTLNNVFTTNFSAEFLEGYAGAPDTTAPFTTESNLPNYLTTERIRGLKGRALRKHVKNTPADHMDFSDRKEEYKLAQYDGVFTLDQQDFINDRMGAIDAMAPREMGEAAGELRGDLVYSILLGNPNMSDSVALFDAAHGNVTTSAALSPTTIKAGVTKMATQTENGRILGRPQGLVLIVPEGLSFDADQYINSPMISEDGGSGTRNALLSRGLSWISDARLDNGVTDPDTQTAHTGSATTWFMAARRGRHVIEVGYLRGTNRQPSIRSFVLSQGQWGMGWDVELSIGAKALDWLGIGRFTA